MLHVRELRVDKDGQTICHVPALRVATCERVALIGPNGSGKTTLLRVLSGLQRETAGEYHIETPQKQRVYVHQTPYLFRGSVLTNVAYGLAARHITRSERLSTVRRWLDVFGIAHLSGKLCHKLSGGERRRVALARAFAVGAKLMLLDEPFTELDEDGIERVVNAIDSAADTTFLIASPGAVPELLDASIESIISQTDATRRNVV